ncbi:MAG: [protein-PII] uridylyltransferase [Verrucomicrobia bacterium]|nr:[protein-PII] uridylyltransferase [Verrucomicrobiota bacterium]
MPYRAKLLAHTQRLLASLGDGEQRLHEMLPMFKRFLKIEEHRLRLEHRAGGGGLNICHERAQLLDMFLQHIYEIAWRTETQRSLPANGEQQSSGPKLALLATGGYGRGELNPFSDVDILFLYDGESETAPEAVDGLVKQVLYLLWDVGFKVGHATRSIDAALAHANADGMSKTALLQARLLAGDAALAAEFARRFEEDCVQGHEREFTLWRNEDQAARLARYGDSVFMQEPNVKFSPGGLRDLHNLLWTARFQVGVMTLSGLAQKKLLSPSESRQLERGYDFLLRVRTDLHFLTQRAGDVLTLFFQGQVATNFGYPQKTIVRRSEAFMKDYYRHARALHLLTDTLFERLQIESAKDLPASLHQPSRSLAPAEHFDGFYSRDGQLWAESRDIFTQDPYRLMRAFLYLQERQLKFSPELALLLRRRVRLVNRTYTYARVARELFVRLLGRRGQVARILRAMHEVDLLGRYVPEFGGLTCLVQHEFVHRYSADEHTLVCLEKLDALADETQDAGAEEERENYPTRSSYVKGYRKLFAEFKDPLILYLSLLLHDTGKATGAQHHAEASALFAQKVAARMQLSSERRRALILLVDHHLTLSMTAQTRNLDDPATITEFAGIVKNRHNLDALMLVTFADGQGTTDQGWSDWKESLVWQLYHATSAFLAEGAASYRHEQRQREVQQRAVAARLPENFAEEIEAHYQHMPARYFDIFDAEAITEHIVLFRQFFGRLEAPSAENRAHEPLGPAVEWIAHPERGHTEVRIAGWKRRSLLTKIAGSFSAAGLNILSADSFTRTDGLAMEIFRVCDAWLRAVSDPRDVLAVERHLRAALAVEKFDFGPLLTRAMTARPPAYQRDGRRTRTPGEEVSVPTRVLTRDDPANQFTLLEVQTADRLGLLYDLLGAINRADVSVVLSRIATDKGAAFDNFYLTDGDGSRLTDAALLGRLRTEVHQAALDGNRQ